MTAQYASNMDGLAMKMDSLIRREIRIFTDGAIHQVQRGFVFLTTCDLVQIEMTNSPLMASSTSFDEKNKSKAAGPPRRLSMALRSS